MGYVLIFLIAYTSGFLGTAIPGLLNMTAGRIALEYGKPKALKFIWGACSVTLIYSFIATQFSFYVEKHPDFVSIIYQTSVLIFGALTIYYFWKSYTEKKSKPDANIDKNNFFLIGVFLSVLNILPIPFYAGITIIIAQTTFFHFYKIDMLLLIVGIALGTFTVLKLYGNFYPKLLQRSIRKKGEKNTINANTIVGYVTLTLTGFALYKLL